MPGISNLTLVNGMNNNVDFNPVGTDSKGVTHYQTFDTGRVYETQDRVSISVKRPTKGGSQAFRVTMKISVPTMDASVSPAKFVADNICNIEFVMSKSAPLLTRQDLRQYALSALQNALTTQLVENQQGLY